MTKSNLSILFITILLLSLGAIGCTSKSEITKTSTVKKKNDEPQEESLKAPAKNLYIMLRLLQNDSTGAISILRVEKQIYERQGNPLPLDANIPGKQLYSCEIKQQNGETVQKSEQKINFTLGDSGNEAILKFILPLHENAHYVEINRLNEVGVWENVYSEKM